MAEVLQDVSQITRILGCTPQYYNTHVKTDPYKDYTIYLVNNGVGISDTGTDGVGEDLVQQPYTDFYYGERKVTDIFVTETPPTRGNYPGNPEYPDDKMYLVPVYINDVPPLSGQSVTDAVGYQIYFKHNGTVSPIMTSLINNVEYDPDTHQVSLVWNLTNSKGELIDEQAVTTLLTDQSLWSLLSGDIPSGVIDNLSQKLSIKQSSIEWHPIKG